MECWCLFDIDREWLCRQYAISPQGYPYCKQNYHCLQRIMRQNFDEELQISEFIKDPASLKLLILAGTNIRSNELITVNKCVSLIKLDLSSNQLADIPLKFINFPQMRILYLHDNQINSISISRTNLEYLSLFDNPINGYRTSLIQSNQKLQAIDYHVITRAERIHHTSPPPYSLLKWPIVEISQSLQHEEDYLNLLKAELFVVSQVYKRALNSDIINRYFVSFTEMMHYKSLRLSVTIESFFKKQLVKKVADQWVNYTEKKKKLKRILNGSENLLLNKLERAKLNRSEGVTQVVSKFIKSIRERMTARKVLEKCLRQYRLSIPAIQAVQKLLAEQPLKLYLKDSQSYYFQKIILYAKKLFFNRKQFDILDNFDKLVHKTNRVYYIYRSKEITASNFVMSIVKNSMGLVLGQIGIDKRNLLYNRQGHKKIQIKRVDKKEHAINHNKTKKTDQKIEKLYKRYDKLVEYQFHREELYLIFLKLIRYFNSGNSNTILQNQAAYFQTQVIFEDKQSKRQRINLFFSSFRCIHRVKSANIIQKWWRRVLATNKLGRNIFKEIRVERAKKLIGKWLRNMTFRHRMQLSKTHSFYKTIIKQAELYLQLDIYMKLPKGKDLLRIKPLNTPSKQNLYQILHSKTEVQIVGMNGRSWIKFKFLDSAKAFQAQKLLSILTYRYYFNGTFIKLFTNSQINYQNDVKVYQKKIEKIFGIKTNQIESISNNIAKKIEIQNHQSYFIWPLVEEGFATMFKLEDVHSLPISVFIYNKNRRPLKVNCDLLWTTPITLYYYRKKARPQARVKTPKKQITPAEYAIQHYMPHVRHKMHRERQFSVKQHKSLLQANRQKGYSQHVQLSLLSQTLNIKRQ